MGVTHPAEFFKVIIDWDTWKSNPLHAFGKLIPDIVIALPTAGAGTAASGASLGSRALSLLRGRRGLPDPTDWPIPATVGRATSAHLPRDVLRGAS